MKTKIITISAIMAAILLVPMTFAQEGRPGPRPRERLAPLGAAAEVFQDLTPEQRDRVLEFVQERLQQQREQLLGQLRNGQGRPQNRVPGRGLGQPEDRASLRPEERSYIPGPLADRFEDMTPQQRDRIRDYFQVPEPEQRQPLEGLFRGRGFGPEARMRGFAGGQNVPQRGQGQGRMQQPPFGGDVRRDGRPMAGAQRYVAPQRLPAPQRFAGPQRFAEPPLGPRQGGPGNPRPQQEIERGPRIRIDAP